MKRCSVAVAVLALALAPRAQAYKFECGWRIDGWHNNGCPTGSQDPDPCNCSANAAPRWYGAQLQMAVENQGGGGITAAQMQQAGRAAAQGWTDVSCSNLQVSASAVLAANNDARWADHNNNSYEHGIFYVASENEWMNVTGSGSSGTMGVTVSPTGGDCSGREFSDTDILINGQLDGGWDYNMLFSTVMHEMGHSLGLGHPCLMGQITGQCSNECQALMGATGGDYLTPQQDDINGLCALYPGTAGGLGSACTGTGSGQCTGATTVCATYEGFSYCTHTCGSCETGYSCKSVNGQNVCVRQGAPGPGENCLGTCAPGAVCIGVSETEAKCFKECPSGNSTDCDNGDQCIALNDGSHICYPPGTQPEGARCGTQTTGDCAAGLTCIGDSSGDANAAGTCYRNCDPNTANSCGSSSLRCVALSGGAGGVCATAAGAGQDCEATGYVCVDGYECAPRNQRNFNLGFICRVGCTFNQPSSCNSDSLECITFEDNAGEPVVAACYPTSGTAADGGQPGRDAGGVVNPGGKGYMEPCNTDGECSFNICVGVSGRGRICVTPCDPRLGHYDCTITDENSGCVPSDPEALNLPGQCQPDVTTNATLGVGQPCSAASGYLDCTSGLCEGGKCLMACNEGSCPKNFTCDTSEMAAPGVCRPNPSGTVCGDCAAHADSPEALWPVLLTALGLTLFAVVRRRQG